MSTPRRPAPRSRAAPITATVEEFFLVVTGHNVPGVVERMGDDSGHTGAICVLLVDDDVDYLASLQVFVERQAELTVVGVAADGWEAVNAAEHLEPDAVVVGLHMPSVDGVTTLARLRQEHPL